MQFSYYTHCTHTFLTFLLQTSVQFLFFSPFKVIKKTFLNQFVFMFTGELFQTPGPGAYSPEKAPPVGAHRRPPSYTIATRTRYRSVDAVPAPNRWRALHSSTEKFSSLALSNIFIFEPVLHISWDELALTKWNISEAQFWYRNCFLPSSYSLPNLLGCQVPNKSSSASYSLSGRRKVGAPSEDLSKSPGPAKYSSINPDVYRQRQPSFSMQSRTKRPNYSTAIPGPGTYNPEKFNVHLRKAPSFTLGVRHSEFVTPLVVQVTDWRTQFKCLVFIYMFTQMWSCHTMMKRLKKESKRSKNNDI